MPVLCDDSSSGTGREHLNRKAHRSTKINKINSNVNSGNNSNTKNNSSSSSNSNSEWGFTQKSLKEALATNRELQAKILSELARIAKRKRDNRLEAERCIERSCAVVLLAGEATGTTIGSTTADSGSKQGSAENEGDSKNNNNDSNDKKATTKRKRKKSIKGDVDYLPTNDDINELLAGGDGSINSNSNSNSNSNININSNSNDDKNNNERTKGNRNNGVEKVIVHNDEKEKAEKQKWSLHLRKKFRYDPYRKWTSDYFIDPTGSRPKENEDTIRRRELMTKKKIKTKECPSTSGQQQQQEDEIIMVPDTFFYHTSQPFTPKEKAFLDKWLLKGSNNSNNNNSNSNNKWIDNGDDDVDSNSFYESVAQKLRQEHHDNPDARKKDRVLLPTCLPRSGDDIRLYHLHRLASQYEFTKEESLAILEGVEETASAEVTSTEVSEAAQRGAVQPKYGEESTQMMNNGDNDNDKSNNTIDRVRDQTIARPDWQKICDRVLEVHRRSQKNAAPPGVVIVNDNPHPPSITPYQCMVHYKTKLRPQPDGSFTPEEDELLLRYIAAMGPQFVWGYPQIIDLASRLFPHKTSRRIYERTHFSQWHPLSKDTIWTKEEEQKLVLAMKIYSETTGSAVDNDENGAKHGMEEFSEEQIAQNKQRARIASEKAALRKAAAHFHPYRQAYKVAKKWERSFSPRFCYKPFSKVEDAKLLASVRSTASTTPFSEIAKKNFPNRSSDQLSQRWSKIAPDKDVVKKYVPSMVRSGLKRGLLSAKSGSNAASSTGEATNNDERSHDDNNSIQNGSGALFDASDFVVEVLENEAKYGKN